MKTLSPDSGSQQLSCAFASSTTCSSLCNRIWLNTKIGMAADIPMNDLHYTKCGMESLAIQMDVTALCGGYYFRVNQELEGPLPIALLQSSIVFVVFCLSPVTAICHCEDTSRSTTPSLIAFGSRRLMSSLLYFGNSYVGKGLACKHC